MKTEVNIELRKQNKKKCFKCLEIKNISEYTKNNQKWDGLRSDCNKCRAKTRKDYRSKNKQKFINYENKEHVKRKQLNLALKRRYSISLIEYEKMLEQQNYLCKICNKKETTKGKKKLAVDHCHKTNKVRGLLCHNCNVSLGLLKDSTTIILNMLNYLKENINENNTNTTC